MPHGVGEGLFAEIEALRAALGRAFCLHRVRLDKPCVPECRCNEARALLVKPAGADAKAAISRVVEKGTLDCTARGSRGCCKSLREHRRDWQCCQHCTREPLDVMA